MPKLPMPKKLMPNIQMPHIPMPRIKMPNIQMPNFHKISTRTIQCITLAALVTVAVFLATPKGRVSIQQQLGLVTKQVTVSGRKQTPARQIAQMLPLGEPLFGVSPHKVKTQLEQMEWVKSAEVHRSLRGKIRIRLKEHSPFALWQASPNKKAVLIAEDGAVIGAKQALDFPHLVTIQSQHSHTRLLKTLAPIKGHSIRSIIQRGAPDRWNVELANGITIMLPEQNPEQAWSDLAKFNRENRLLERNLKTVDMRIKDRLIVSLNKPAKKSAKKSVGKAIGGKSIGGGKAGGKSLGGKGGEGKGGDKSVDKSIGGKGGGKSTKATGKSLKSKSVGNSIGNKSGSKSPKKSIGKPIRSKSGGKPTKPSKGKSI